MAQLDTYLVEKLREILQRLYSKNKVPSGGDESGFSRPPHHSDFDALSHQQQQQVGYKRSPYLFPYAPAQEDMQSKGESLSKKIELESAFSVKENIGESDYSKDRSITTQSIYGTARFAFKNESAPSNGANYSEPITYGVEVNCTTTGIENSENSSLVELGKVEKSEDESSALTRNLHEFIHILKMSLKSGASAFSTDEHGSVFSDKEVINAAENYGSSRDGTTATGSADPFSGIEVASATNMEFNLTLDDILDLNNLLEDDSTFGVPVKHILIIVIYLMIACVSIIGNLLVVQLVIRSRRFHTLTHALLANLAAADLFLATFNIPFSAARVIMTEWPFGSFLCRTVPFVQVTSVYATSFTMAVIAMDRYQVIMNPLGKRLKCSQGILLVIAIWIVSAVLSLPYALNHQVVTVLTVRIVKRCQAEFGSLGARRLLTVATFLAQYLLPLLFTTASYIAIMRRLWHRSSGLGSTTPRQVAAQSRAKRKTIKMLVLTVICFAISWAPINIYHLLTHFSHVRHNSTAILTCHIIAMSSSMYNPFIFCGLNEHFRREAIKWLHCFRTRRSPIVHPGTEVNGMLTRADQTSRRNVSTTVVHTTVSSRRSPQQHISVSPCQRRRILAASSTPITTPTAVYITPRHNISNPVERVELSPVASRLGQNLETSRSGNGGSSSPSRYQPEMLFLVKSSHTVSLDEMDSGDDVMNGDDFLDSFCDEWNSCGDYANGKSVSNEPPDLNDKMSPSKVSVRDMEEGADEDSVDDDDGKAAETTFMGDCETAT